MIYIIASVLERDTDVERDHCLRLITRTKFADGISNPALIDISKAGQVSGYIVQANQYIRCDA